MTKLNYLQDSYLFESSGEILEIGELDERNFIILDETIFYPQGGGQKSDTGQIIFDSGDIFEVLDVRMDENGKVFHFGSFSGKNFENLKSSGIINNKKDLEINPRVSLKINKEQRILSARIHSAGHLLDVAISKIGLDFLEPTKGFHFPEGSYVEYSGVLEDLLDLEKKEKIIKNLETVLSDLIEKNLKVETDLLDPEIAKEKGFFAPTGKKVRIVKFENESWVGCGGTHVKKTSEIGKINIRKIKSKKGITRISYEVL